MSLKCESTSEPHREIETVSAAPPSGRLHTKGEGVVCLQGAYHGNTDQLIKIAPYKPKPGLPPLPCQISCDPRGDGGFL